MRGHTLVLGLLELCSFVVAWPKQPLSLQASDDIEVAAKQVDRVARHAYQKTKEQVKWQKNSQCTLRNLVVRKEWGALSGEERIAYTDAVLCLQSKAANTPSELVPGAKSRYDDFIAVHDRDFPFIHVTGTFLSWHRYYTWTYEQALRNECGYQGAQPYWDWTKTAMTGLENSPLFDGSTTSMSGNGEYVANEGIVLLEGPPGTEPVPLPRGSGGGCVTSGPFKHYTVNLGPVLLPVPGGTTIQPNISEQFRYNPRCLKRDLTNFANTRYCNSSSVAHVLLDPQIVWDFQTTMQGVSGTVELGVHGGGHYSLGGDPGRDPYVSPGDPMFYLHHAMIDKVWWMWQMLDPSTRAQGSSAISGTGTIANTPPSANTTLDDIVEFWYAGGDAGGVSRRVGDLLSTVQGPFCYVYV